MMEVNRDKNKKCSCNSKWIRVSLVCMIYRNKILKVYKVYKMVKMIKVVNSSNSINNNNNNNYSNNKTYNHPL